MNNIIHIKSVTQAHELMGIEKPKHPLISVFRHTPETNKDFSDIRLAFDLYFIALKDGIKGKFKYGRSTYDFEEGALTFISPGQVISEPDASDIDSESAGWNILIHPDLIRKSPLGKNIGNYSFFNYDINEALHLSDKEKQALTELVYKIEEEISQNIDKHTQKLIVSNLELLLDYCGRYYDRQFFTRSNMNKDTVTQFEKILRTYFGDEKQLDIGLPTVKYCAEQIGMSANYMSDMLKKETGRNAQDHIHGFIIEKAKTILLNSGDSISQIAYGLGFDYSQHFSRIFKAKTGMSPKEYRTIN